MTGTSSTSEAQGPARRGLFAARDRRVVLAAILMIAATLTGSLVPIVAHHANPAIAGVASAAMLAFEIGAYLASLVLVIRRLRAASRAPLGRGGSHL